MGRVFAGELKGPAGFRKQVALKVIRGNLDTTEQGYQEDFLREARIMGLLRHPNLVDCYDFGFEQGHPFIAMEHIDGTPLRKLLSQVGRLPVTAALDLAIQICAGLSHAHSLEIEDRSGGLVHRDLKPGNVLVTNLGMVKVLDFGLALAAGQTSPDDASDPSRVGIQGTPGYMSPEQARSEKLDERSDLFSAGLILFEAITGERFFLGENSLVLIFAASSLTDPGQRAALADTYLPGISSIIGRCLRSSPSERFSRASQLRESLEHVLRSLPPGPSLRSLMAGQAQQSRSGTTHTALEDQSTLRRPSPRETDTQEEALRSERDSAPTSGIRASAVLARQTNIPPEASSFIGRHDALRHLSSSVQPGRTVTLVGSGGSGKTRLAIHFGIQNLNRWVTYGGVWFSELAEARTNQDLIATVARVLGVSLADLDPCAGDAAALRVGWALAGRGRLLLILDNFEQLAPEAATTLDSWLDMAPELCLLVTSRQALRSARETVLLLEALSPVEAVQLFEDRAKGIRAEFALSEVNLPIVHEIVKRLDHIPLAVELAAARSGLLSPSQILDRLAERFRLLSNKSGGRSTLEGTIAWSWDLLKPHEQEALWQCTAFRGSFRIEAAEEVLDLSHHQEAPWPLDLLETLREKSLLSLQRSRERPDEGRFRILESIRAFAEAKSSEFDSWPELVARHAAAGLAYSEKLAHRWKTHGDVHALEALRLEEENLLVIHDRQLATNPQDSARAAICLTPLLSQSRTLGELSAFLTATIETSREAQVDSAILAQLLSTLGSWTPTLRSIEANCALLEESVRLSTEAGDHRGSCLTLCTMCTSLLNWHRLSEAAEALSRAQRIGAALADPSLQPHVTNAQAALVYFEDPAESTRLHLEALRQWEALGHIEGASRELNFLAILASERQDLEQAATLFRESLLGWRELGLRTKAVMATANLGLLSAQLGQIESSRKTLHSAISEAVELGLPWLEVMAKVSLIELEVVAENITEAARIADGVTSLAWDSLSPLVRVNLRVAQATAYRLSGQLDRAVTTANQALLASESAQERASLLALSCIVLANCMSKAGQHENARIQLSRASQAVDRTDDDSPELRVLQVVTATVELLEAECASNGKGAELESAVNRAQTQVEFWDSHLAKCSELELRTQFAVFKAEFTRLSKS